MCICYLRSGQFRQDSVLFRYNKIQILFESYAIFVVEIFHRINAVVKSSQFYTVPNHNRAKKEKEREKGGIVEGEHSVIQIPYRAVSNINNSNHSYKNDNDS